MQIKQAITLCQNGQTEAFRVLVEEFSPKALRFAVHILKNKTEAEDLVQETFIQVWKSIKTLKNPDSFKSWLFTILNNLCKRKSKIVHEEELPEENELVCPQHKSDFERIDNAEMIEKYFTHLSGIKKKVLILREMEELSYTEIANILDIPEGTVKSRIASARTSLRDLYLKKEGF